MARFAADVTQAVLREAGAVGTFARRLVGMHIE